MFSTVARLCLRFEVLDAKLKSLAEAPIRRDGGEFLVWNPPVCGHEYLVAVDPAGKAARRETILLPRCSISPPACSAPSCRRDRSR